MVENVDEVKELYDEFVEQISGAYRAGRALGWEDVAAAAAAAQVDIKGQYENAGVEWGVGGTMKAKKPAGFHVETGPLSNTEPPPRCIDPDEFEKAVTNTSKALEVFEKQVSQEQLGGFADIAPEQNSEWLSAAVEHILDEAEIHRAQYDVLNKQTKSKVKAHNQLKTDVDVMVVAAGGEVMSEREEVLKRNFVFNPHTGKSVQVSSVLKAFQLRDYHSDDRSKRFIVGRLRDFTSAVQEGHDVMLGTVVLVKWGGKTQFAVGRVMNIHTDEGRRYSCVLDNKIGSKQSFSVELMDPVATKRNGSQSYIGSGYMLPELSGCLIIKPVQLIRLDGLANEDEEVHEAVLSVTEIEEMQTQGLARVTADCGYLHVQNVEEMAQDGDSGIMWGANTKKSQHKCLQCHTSYYDDSTGLIVRCKTCFKAWHCQCAAPVLKLGDFDEKDWECVVCTGENYHYP